MSEFVHVYLQRKTTFFFLQKTRLQAAERKLAPWGDPLDLIGRETQNDLMKWPGMILTLMLACLAFPRGCLQLCILRGAEQCPWVCKCKWAWLQNLVYIQGFGSNHKQNYDPVMESFSPSSTSTVRPSGSESSGSEVAGCLCAPGPSWPGHLSLQSQWLAR